MIPNCGSSEWGFSCHPSHLHHKSSNGKESKSKLFWKLSAKALNLQLSELRTWLGCSRKSQGENRQEKRFLFIYLGTLAHRRGFWLWLWGRIFNGISEKRAEPRFHSNDFTQPPKGTPNSQRDASSQTLNLRERWTALRLFQRNSPFRMRKWQFDPWDWSGWQVSVVKRFLFC